MMMMGYCDGDDDDGGDDDGGDDDDDDDAQQLRGGHAYTCVDVGSYVHHEVT